MKDKQTNILTSPTDGLLSAQIINTLIVQFIIMLSTHLTSPDTSVIHPKGVKNVSFQCERLKMELKVGNVHR